MISPDARAQGAAAQHTEGLEYKKRSDPTISLEQAPEKAILAGFERRRGAASRAASESFHELSELAASAGAEVAAEVFQVRPVVDAATLLGYGKVQELKRNWRTRSPCQSC